MISCVCVCVLCLVEISGAAETGERLGGMTGSSGDPTLIIKAESSAERDERNSCESPVLLEHLNRAV